MDIFCQYIPIELKIEVFSLVKITDKKILYIIPLVLVDFLVMKKQENRS